ncbi:FHA domain-containing protein [Aliterella atlantica]|uniref:FHA domain-containing protein n=1 Tax=Aliterella atlantica TaxID=1827278 RepID=UPI000A97B7EC|nr:FHA domain-containing protein [Aliterella atlantica]
MQSWKFEDKSLIRIGRATDNEVVLYSSVVSRLHLELRESNGKWELISRGANGTFVGDERISQVPVVDGTIVRIAPTGPKIQIRLGDVASAEEKAATKESN